jgi:repressor LexA
VVRQTTEAKNDEVVVALLEDEATVKRFRRTDTAVELLPENPDYEPIVLSPSAFSRIQILGRVVAVLRRYE